MTAPKEAQVQTLMMFIVKYVVSNKNKGLILSPKVKWTIVLKFKVHIISNPDQTKNPDNCRSISGGKVFLNGMPKASCSVTHKFAMFSVTHAKLQQA